MTEPGRSPVFTTDSASPEPSPTGPARAGVLGKAAAALAVCIVVAALVLLLVGTRDPRPPIFAQASQLAAPQDGDTWSRFADVAEQATAAVVRIEAEFRPGEGPVEDVPDVLEPFFGPDAFGEPPPRVAGGSGFIISPDGRILTNAHVVQGGDLTVWLDDRRSFPAQLIGLDPTTDVAVLDIEADDLPVLPLGDSDRVRVGDWVLAIGSPGVGAGQLDQTVTAGIISAIGRPLQLLSRDLLRDTATRQYAPYAIENFLQTDAVINPGNSGGPLLDLSGRVIGINSAIASPTGFYSGYGFAVPSNLVTGVLDDLVEYGEVRRGRLGVSVTTVTPEDAEYFHLDEVSGALVQSAEEGSPAAAAGIRRGDVILSLDGEEVVGAGDLQQEVAEREPGTRVTLEIMRDGRRQEVEVELGEMELALGQPPEQPPEEDAIERIGLALGALTPERRSELGLGADVAGAVVLEVEPRSPAGQKGVVPGSVILEVGGEGVASPSDVAERLDDVESGGVTSLLIRTPDGAERLVTVRVP
ncbi:MAG TPA: trypsin-like peptidase domain-containing protein [Longimicrobiales bacterium]|nr:trypsin-like peptidase domain-containing protein [Longimicrobiales bacterium]